MSSEDAVGMPDQQRLPVRKLDMPAAAKYADLISVAEDLTVVVQACERLRAEQRKPENDHDEVVAKSLWTTALVMYARCFGTGKRKGLTLEDVRTLPLQGEVVEWHQYLIDMRNKHIAHSVNPFEIISIGGVVAPSGRVEGVAHVSMRYVGTDDGGVWQIASLAAELLGVINGRIEQQW